MSQNNYARIILISFFLILHIFNNAWANQDTVTFVNKSGMLALVKLIGPTTKTVAVPVGEKKTVSAAPGSYHIKVRYGSSGNYTYSKGQEFVIKQSATNRSRIAITLHKVVDGNYKSNSISANEFARDPQQPVGSNDQQLISLASNSTKIGPWSLSIISVRITSVFNSSEGGEIKPLSPENKIAIVKVRLTVIRDYSGDELSSIGKDRLSDAAWKLRPTGSNLILVNNWFMLFSRYGDNDKNILISKDPFFVTESGLQRCTITFGQQPDINYYVGWVNKNEVTITLVFNVAENDSHPILTFSPSGDIEKQNIGARLSLIDKGSVSVEFGKLSDINQKYYLNQK